MLSKNQIKLIKSLTQKKFREQHGLFTVEGIKGITEFINSNVKLHQVFTTSSVFNIPKDLETLISDSDLRRISQLKTPNTALALFEIPETQAIDSSRLIVALDMIRDPGNLGTIIRLCDWFDIKDLICSKTTVDCYNSKVVQASMGSLARVNLSYLDLEMFIKDSQNKIFGTFLEGNNIYNYSLPKQGIIVLGNEANGISKTVESLITEKITIPNFGELQQTESLNVAMATAIVLSEFKRMEK